MSLLLLGSFPGKRDGKDAQKRELNAPTRSPMFPQRSSDMGCVLVADFAVPHLHQYLRRWNQQPPASGGRQPRRNGLDVLNIRYALHDLQHRWLFRDTPLDLQQDRSLPVVQLHDLVVFHNRICECCLIACLHSICEEA